MSKFFLGQKALQDHLDTLLGEGQITLVSLAIIILSLCSLTILYIYLFYRGLNR